MYKTRNNKIENLKRNFISQLAAPLFFRGALIFFCVLNMWLHGLDSELHKTTIVPYQSRYEFIQSPITARDTFKVDKFMGEIYQVVKKSDGDLTWQKVTKISHDADKKKEGQVNYQLFMSGITARDTYLINIWTGATWQLTGDRETGLLFWAPIY